MLIERRGSRRLMNQINVVPYIDVMLVLLVIFMVTAPLINPGQVELPSVGKSSNPPVAPLEVSIHTDQSLWMRDRAAGTDERTLAGIRNAENGGQALALLLAAPEFQRR